MFTLAFFGLGCVVAVFGLFAFVWVFLTASGLLMSILVSLGILKDPHGIFATK